MLYAISDFRGVKPIRFFRTIRSHPLKLEDIVLFGLYFFLDEEFLSAFFVLLYLIDKLYQALTKQ
jgi:hypothetical protein